MLQRLKGAIDSRIAEEQARQRALQHSPSRSSSGTNRPSNRTGSPNKRAARRKDDDSSLKGPDPSEFEPENVIGNEDIPVKSETPRPAQRKDGVTMANDGPSKEPSTSNNEEVDRTTATDSILISQELPTDVRVKLRKLEKLESKYSELLKFYRRAHAQVLSIEPFEKSLRENTPLTSISDPAALAEYLNQVNLKSDMVLDELKRVSAERDKSKEDLIQANQNTKEAWDEVTNLRKQSDANRSIESFDDQKNRSPSKDVHSQSSIENDPLSTSGKAQPNSTRSPTSSMTRLPVFAPGSKTIQSPVAHEAEEDFFSYDSELPRLESELKDRQNEKDELQIEVTKLKGDLSVARESTQSMVGTLEEATRELQALRERKDQLEADSHRKLESVEIISQQLKSDLQMTEEKLRKSVAESSAYTPSAVYKLENQLKETQDELGRLRSGAAVNGEASGKVQNLTLTIKNMESDMVELRSNIKQSEKRTSTLESLVKSLRTQLSDADEEKQRLTAQASADEKSRRTLQHRVTQLQLQMGSYDRAAAAASDQKKNDSTPLLDSALLDDESMDAVDAITAAKKKSKRKKKKGGRAAFTQNVDSQAEVVKEQSKQRDDQHVPSITQATIVDLQEELDRLRVSLVEKDTAIDRMHGKLKRQEDLSEEIESLRDDLVNVGQDHVVTKDKVKELTAEKRDLLTSVEDLERELADLRGAHAFDTAGSKQKQEDLTKQYEDLKIKVTTLQTDLAAAQQLASSRFKDLTDLKGVLQKAQPEINALRSEAADTKAVKEALAKKEAEFKRLDARHEEMRAEVAKLKQSTVDRDLEIKSLNQKIIQETATRLKAEDVSNKTSQEIQHLETEKRQATESLDKLSRDLAKSRDDLASSRVKLRDFEQQLSQLKRDNEGFKEDVELKTAQYASAQSLMVSMRDQTAEMAMQRKEARDRCESLEEELAEAHRLLSERSREGETMRRLLADVEGRADSRTREMKERMDTAIEERDRAEDEASTAARRKARELEDLRNRLRETERGFKKAEEDKEELEISQRDWKRRREELEQRSEQHAKEMDEVRKAMGELRDALDESERQARELEKHKAEMRRSVEDTQHRLEKLQKSNKSMADEIRSIQKAKTRAMDSETQSSRSSSDSMPPRAGLGTPAPKTRGGSTLLTDAPSGQVTSAMDYVYLKNVLLQFLEQKDKKHQVQLIPVLGMLLHFDR
ncbi:hypothetical protein MMC07_001792 [Pseudocyphellaria aurata]|nr:hypothetical protein [Pseudocyphellaria aurata]